MLWAAVLVTAILCLAYASQATTVANSNSYALDGPADKRKCSRGLLLNCWLNMTSLVNTWQLAAFNKCCVETYSLTSKVSPCGTEQTGGSYTGCIGQVGQLCACYNDENLYEEVVQYLKADECEALSRIQFSSNEYLIGDPANSSGR